MQADGQQIPVEFTYSVLWRETKIPFEKRMDKYRKYQFLPQHLEVGGVTRCSDLYYEWCGMLENCMVKHCARGVVPGAGPIWSWVAGRLQGWMPMVTDA
jgi:hypothetical protein